MATRQSQALGFLRASDAEIAEECGVSERAVRKWREGGGITKKAARRLGVLLRVRGERMQALADEIERDT